MLRDGYVEQVGSPMELYNNPANQFVAGFLGSPPMNFIPGAILGKDEALTVGIRPEDISVASKGGLEATIEHVEQLGGDTNIVTRIKGQRVTARLFGQHILEKGQTVHLTLDDRNLFHFDKAGICKN